MPFKHIIDDKKNIVVLKAKGKVTVPEIISEIQKAIDTKRGDGVTRRLIDMTDQVFDYEMEDARKIVKMMKVSANVLGSRRVAILFEELPETFDFESFESDLKSPTLEIAFFTDRAKAAHFLSRPPKKKR